MGAERGRRALLRALAAAALPAAAAGPRRVTDMAGRSVALPAQIGRIVTLGSLPVLNSFVFTFGEGRRIVNGLADFARPHWKYQTVFAPQLAGQPTLQQPNREPNLEAVLQARPDLVLTMQRDSAEQLAAHGLCCVCLAWREPDDLRGCMRLLGQVFDKPAVAQRYLGWLDATLARLARGLQGLAPAQRPRVLYLQPETLTQPRLIAEWWIPTAGGISVSADGRSTESRSFSVEQVLAWDPDLLILTTPQALQRLRADRVLSRLKAVRSGRMRVAPVGAHSWANRTAEQPLTLLWAARTFHPARFADVDLVAEARGFYRDFFGHALADAELAEILSGTL